MNKALIMVLIVAILGGTGLVFAQDNDSASSLDKSGTIRMPSELYPIRLDVTRIYSHSDGYRVLYRKGQAQFADVYIPIQWFVPGGKAQLILGRGSHFPYLVVYYSSDGSFSHLKLYAPSSLTDSSWATLESDGGDRFNVDTIKQDF
ncbi:MAG: hypothetical protein ABIJ86_14145 [Spirochaetota bacterium]